MKVLLIGLSSIAARRVVPALERVAAVSGIDVASRGKSRPAGFAKPGAFYDDYATALRESEAELVYVSLPNSMHVEWVERSLAAGKHVIVDKPATLTSEAAQFCVEQARARGLLLAEATVFSYHRQCAVLGEFVRDHGPLTHVEARFVIPPIALENFRNHSALGGGCLHDMSPYAAAVARLFGGSAEIIGAVGAPPAPDRDIDMGFSLLARLEGGARFSGAFSFESEYHNSLTLICRNGAVEVDRIFSPPPDFEPTFACRIANKRENRRLPAGDAFEEFLAKVIRALGEREHDRFYGDLLTDAQFRAELDRALAVGKSEVS